MFRLAESGTRASFDLKIEGVIKGRTIKAASASGGALNVTFDDSSTMKIKVAAQTSSDALNGHTIKAVRQSGTAPNLDFTDGSNAQITLAEATSSVMLRDVKGAMEYVD